VLTLAEARALARRIEKATGLRAKVSADADGPVLDFYHQPDSRIPFRLEWADDIVERDGKFFAFGVQITGAKQWKSSN
jgi:hypothetical protein